jgi:alpha-L-fucosidase
MYASKYTEWDASEKGPKRDIIAELEKAARAKGLKFGVSSHRAFNWMYYVRQADFDNADPKFAGLYGRPMPFLFDEKAPDYKKFFPPQDKQFKDDWLARSCELVDRFHPDLMWFDFGITATKETSFEDNHYSPYLQRYAAYYYNVSKQAGGDLGIINYKWKAFPEKAAVLDLERSKMDAIRQPFWQTDTAVSSSSWGYTKNQKYKSPNRLVDDLVDIVAKNGCLLLNVGPRSDGTIPDEDKNILLAIGKWLDLNGEAIYESKFWKVHGEGPTGTATGHLAEHKDKPFTAEDIRFTSKPGVLYATLLDWPKDGVTTIKTLAKGSPQRKEAIHSVELIGSKASLEWKQTENGLRVVLPKNRPCEFAYVLKIQ